MLRFAAGVGFSLLHSVQTFSEAHPASYPMGSGTLSPVVKRPVREGYDSHPSSAEVRNAGVACISPFLNVFWHSA
jgi:hypothetical protein